MLGKDRSCFGYEKYPVSFISQNLGPNLGEEQNKKFQDRLTGAQGQEVATTLSVLLTKVTTLYSNHNKGKTSNSIVILGCLDMVNPFYSVYLKKKIITHHGHKILKNSIKADTFKSMCLV